MNKARLREIIREETNNLMQNKDLRDLNLDDLEIKFICWLYNLPENTGGPWADETNYWYIATDHLINILKDYIKNIKTMEDPDSLKKGMELATAILEKVKLIA